MFRWKRLFMISAAAAVAAPTMVLADPHWVRSHHHDDHHGYATYGNSYGIPGYGYDAYGSGSGSGYGYGYGNGYGYAPRYYSHSRAYYGGYDGYRSHHGGHHGHW